MHGRCRRSERRVFIISSREPATCYMDTHPLSTLPDSQGRTQNSHARVVGMCRHWKGVRPRPHSRSPLFTTYQRACQPRHFNRADSSEARDLQPATHASHSAYPAQMVLVP